MRKGVVPVIRKSDWTEEKKPLLEFFEKFNLKTEVEELLSEIDKQPDSKQSEIFYLLYKTENILDVCSFVEKRKVERHVDCDRFKVFLLISFAESIARINSKSNAPETLLRVFFSPVKRRLKFKFSR